MAARVMSAIRLVNGSTGDPGLYIDYPGSDNALLFDAGDNSSLTLKELSDLEAVFITHHHIDHFIGIDRIMRANADRDKILNLFGPPGTIDKVYQRMVSYQHQFFDFQKCVFRLNELHEGKIRTGDADFSKKLPIPDVTERSWRGRMIYETADFKVEAVPVLHTAPCFAFAMIEKNGYHPDTQKMESGTLKKGPWVQQALRLLREEAPLDTMIEIGGGLFPLAKLAEQFFHKSAGAKIAYVTDTIWNEETQPGLIQLCKGAWRLYCDSYYSIHEIKSSVRHKHMTATHATELAKAAKVDQLVLMHFAPRYASNYGQLIEEARALFPKVSADLSASS